MSTRPREYCTRVALLALENVRPEAGALVGFLHVHAVRCPQKTAKPRQLSVAVKPLSGK